ncbi:branched-chain amino acid ABC transporter permease [Oscillospiraceae bacterium MB08-C2-2]|nr:branched-chain amino acid ABC transporter permease [Oscillospiraceae bacterium MB08-C2-2]
MKTKALLKKYLPLVCVVVLYIVIALVRQAKIVNNYHIQLLMFAGINIMMTVSLNIVNGFTGQFCIGHAGFMSLGAYGAAVVSTLVFKGYAVAPGLQIPIFLLSLLCGGIIAAFIGLLIGLPTLKLKGDYLAIVTLAFGEIVRAMLRLIEPIGAARGMIGIPTYSNLAWILTFVVLTLWVARNFIYSKYGRACISIRDNEIAADAMGVQTTRYKIIAFCFAAFIAGVAGGLYAHVISFIQPDSFSFSKSSDFLVYLYAGGAGSLSGSIIGALLLTILPEALRFMSNWRLVIYSLVLICVMLFRPSGLCGGKELPCLRINRQELYPNTVFKQKQEKALSIEERR